MSLLELQAWVLLRHPTSKVSWEGEGLLDTRCLDSTHACKSRDLCRQAIIFEIETGIYIQRRWLIKGRLEKDLLNGMKQTCLHRLTARQDTLHTRTPARHGLVAKLRWNLEPKPCASPNIFLHNSAADVPFGSTAHEMYLNFVIMKRISIALGRVCMTGAMQ